ncbi:hypothetical protein N2152v2_002190 [Parachlorella kessleri]
MSKKRLADELAELFNPAPTKELDPDADPFGGGPALVESDEELAADVQHVSRRARESAFRMRGDIQMDGLHYKGRRTSRRAAFGGQSDSEDGSGSDSEGGAEGVARAGSAGEEEDNEGLGLGGLEGVETDAIIASDDEPAGGDMGRQQQERLQTGRRRQQQQHWQRGRSRREATQGNGHAAHLASDGHAGGLGSGSDSDEQGAAGDDSNKLPNGGPGSDSEELGTGEEMEEGDGRDGSAAGQSSDEASMDAAEASSDEEGAKPAVRPGSPGEPDDEMAELEREYEAMRAAEAEAAAGLRERAQREQHKALAVRAQAQLWGRGLELRILLQRALQGANRLPQAQAHGTAAAASEELLGGFSSLAQEAVGLLGDLSDLAETLYQQNPAVCEAAAGAQAGRKRLREGAGAGEPSCEQLWAELDGLYSGFAPFRDAALDRWHRKTTLTTGSAVRSSLKALNQSVSSQVAAMMRDPHKLLLRTRLLRSHSKPLGGSGGAAAEQAEAGVPEANGTSVSKLGGPAADEGGDERDPETFDDTEFYQTLLKEFLEGSGAAASGSGNWLSGPKQRKVVDRRASKGRKIRYHVHEKLVNFMTPVDQDAPVFASQLFSNLFGGPRGA